MAEILSIISTVSYILAALFLILAVFLWFKFKIPIIVGDLTGRNAKKSIAKIRENNEKTGVKTHRSSKTNVDRGKLTTDIKKENKKAEKSTVIDYYAETGLLNENNARNANDVVVEQGTSLLNSDTTETLDDAETTLLADGRSTQQRDEAVKRLDFRMLEEIIMIHTDEVIT